MIRNCRMVNCQSWADSSFSFNEGINVFVADNNVGKSVFFKMLKITSDPGYFSAAARKELIRYGADSASVWFQTDTGLEVLTQVGKTKVVYFVERPGEEPYATEKLSDDVLRELGLLTNDGYVLNILDAEQDLLLVNSNLASNYKLVDMIVSNPVLISMMDQISDVISEVSDTRNSLGSWKGSLGAQLLTSQYVDLKQEQFIVESSKGLLKVAELIESLKLTEPSDFEETERLFNLLSKVQDRLQTVERFRNLDDLVGLVERVNGIGHIADPATDDVTSIGGLIGVLGALSHIAPCTEFCVDKKAIELLGFLESVHILDVPSDSEICRLRKEIEEQSRRCKCEVYGEVYYNGETCVPCSD